MNNERWLLPEGIEELLPPQAWSLESLRRDLLDLYRSWGYELIIPPLIEYLESLLTGAGGDLDLQTFKLTDQMSGRLMGVRADITPQAARIDAHQLRREGPTRLCYLGPVLHTRPTDFAGSRSPLQTGAELFGHTGAASDVEILCLMMATLECCGIGDVYLDLGHVGVFRGLARQAGLDTGQERALFDALQRKAVPEIESLVESFGVDDPSAQMLIALTGLDGDDALEAAREKLSSAEATVQNALNDLGRVAESVRRYLPGVPLHFDLGELRGYRYQTGVVFAAFVPGLGQEIARGGRYDAIGSSFGNPRPATGFSADVNRLLGLGKRGNSGGERAIFSPSSDDIALRDRINELRAAGRRVICALPGQRGGALEMGCSEVLERQGDDWVVAEIKSKS